ncbi:MAG: adenosylhomocysteinase [Xanthobacteraceae bacterium]|nr:adenosylhomocysteinase [Xanthobacteraceae bacterium]
MTERPTRKREVVWQNGEAPPASAVVMSAQKFDVSDLALAEAGRKRIDWALSEMPVVHALIERFTRHKPLRDTRISACLHVTTETANLARVLIAGGADLVLCASNPLSTQDDVAAALVHHGISVFARRGETHDDYYRHLNAALDHRPQITLDDGADLVSELHKHRHHLLDGVLGGTEETTTGVLRLRAMARAGALRYPIIAVNDAMTKHLFDNRYGTGQSTLDGLIRATNFLMAGKTVTVAGYGWCGRGIAMRARGLGARVIVTEVDPVRALEALMDGFHVMPMAVAAPESHFIVTATGDKNVVDDPHFDVIKDGAVIANAGHFDVEINLPALRQRAVERTQPRPSVEEYRLKDGRHVRLLAEGRLVNLAAAEGHPSAVMDMSFANQALSVAHIRARHADLAKAVHDVPPEIDSEVARLKLQAMDVVIDTLTAEQGTYLSSWQEGT